MKAVRAQVGGRVGIEDVPEPDPGPGEVVVKVAGAGLCHSDVTIAQNPDYYGEPPFTLGHETAGHVAALGAGVTGLEVGQPVIVHAMWGCGRCTVCRRGLERLCPTVGPEGGAGLGRDGGMTDLLLVPAARYVLPLPDELDPVDAGPLDDAALTPYHAISNSLAYLGPGRVAVAIGVGGVGHMGVQILRTLGSSHVVAVEKDPERRAFAVELGADRALDPDDDVGDQVRSLDPTGASFVIDFVGMDETLALAAQVAALGGKIVLIGAALGTLPYSLITLPWECSIQTSYAGEPRDLEEVLALARDGRIQVHTRHISIDEVPAALDALDRGAGGLGRMIARP